MSQDITATLLPASRVDFFVLDDATAETAQKLSADWRFARVGIQINKSGIEQAIATYTQYASPEVIIIETSDISENFVALLGQLAGVCAEGTDAVIVGPTNDVHLYRSLVGMGVRDYLVRPVGTDDIVKIIAKALIDKRGLSGSRLVSVIGSKGGAGATSIAQLLAWNVAETQKQKTMLMDAAGSAGSLGIAYGLEPATTFAETVRVGANGSDDDMKRIMQTVTDQLTMLVCGGDPILSDSPDVDSYETLVNRVMQKHPVVVIDLSGAAAPIQKRILSRSSHVVLVTTAMLPSLRNCRTLLTELKHLRASLKEVDLVLNKKGMAAGEELSEKDIVRALDVEPSLTLAYQPKIFAAGEATGKPIGQNKAAADLMRSVSKLAARVAGTVPVVEEEGDGKKDGGMNLLKLLGKKK
ncbi:MAG: CpaE family protein [Alphaproteobacteria bacterium]